MCLKILLRDSWAWLGFNFSKEEGISVLQGTEGILYKTAGFSKHVFKDGQKGMQSDTTAVCVFK